MTGPGCAQPSLPRGMSSLQGQMPTSATGCRNILWPPWPCLAPVGELEQSMPNQKPRARLEHERKWWLRVRVTMAQGGHGVRRAFGVSQLIHFSSTGARES